MALLRSFVHAPCKAIPNVCRKHLPALVPRFSKQETGDILINMDLFRRLTIITIISFLIAVFFPCLLCSCTTADGVYYVTGRQREAVPVEEVAVYTEAPQNYEVIGIVTASSEIEFSRQSSLTRAIEELKIQAATIGANGVLISGTNTSTSGMVHVGYGIFTDISNIDVSGQAIYVY